MTHLASSRRCFISRLCDHRSRFTSRVVVATFGGVTCLVNICDCLLVLCTLRDAGVSLSRLPSAGVTAGMSTASLSFLALSSLTALETVNNNGFNNPHLICITYRDKYFTYHYYSSEIQPHGRLNMIYSHTAQKVYEELVCVCVCVCHTSIHITGYSSQKEHKMAALKWQCATCTFLLVLKSQPMMKKLTKACIFSENVR